jgi:CBS domain-containing protein
VSDRHPIRWKRWRADEEPWAITVPEDMLARDVAHLMHSKNITRVPVLRDGMLVGIATRADLIRVLAMCLADH